jgi:hypothetical protein
MDKIISFGAGVNSVAMTIMLYKRGEIYPCVFADTMAEHPETYCYMDYFEKEFMSKYGQKIIKINPIATPEYYTPLAKGKSLEEYCFNKKIVPMAMQNFCSGSWKRSPLEKYSKESYIIGFAYDERNRARDKIYPLIENKITRQGCIDIIQRENLSVPPKSGCYFCPNQRIAQWEELYKNHPNLFTTAQRMENNTGRFTIRFDVSLGILRERFESKGADLFPDYDYEELTPCVCIT